MYQQQVQGQPVYYNQQQGQPVYVQPMVVQQQQPGMQQPLMMQEAVIMQGSPMLVQQPVYVQQQPMMVQQQPGVMYTPQSMQPMMTGPATNYSQQGAQSTVGSVYPVMQNPGIIPPLMNNPALLSSMQGAVEPPPKDIIAVEQIWESIKTTSSFSINYMDRSFKKEGGYKFSLNQKGKNKIIAYAYASNDNNITIETIEEDSPFVIAQIKNGTLSYYDYLQNKRVTIGNCSITQGSCKSFQIIAEKQGNPFISFQNAQFDMVFCCLCPLIYALQIHVCRNKTDFEIFDKKKSTLFGEAKYLTDELNTFRELDILVYTSKDFETNLTALFSSLVFMYKTVHISLSKSSDVYF